MDDGRQPMSNDECRSIPTDFGQSRLNVTLGVGIQSRCCL